MRIAINHLTRMQKGYICTAGINLEDGKHVRAVLPSGRLTTGYLSRNGGPFDIANVVELINPRLIPGKPHTEDYVFNPSNTRIIRSLNSVSFWNLLNSVCESKLVDIFGAEIGYVGQLSCGTGPGEGMASLGCLRCTQKPRLYTDTRYNKTRIRIQVNDGNFYLDLGVTDLRLYNDDHLTPDLKKVASIADKIKQSEDVILCVGLTRPFSSSPQFDPVCWLQVNNIHTKENPTWQLG